MVPVALVALLLRLLAPVTASSHTAICAIVRDQNDDLEEWIQHHRSIGIQKFYIYDNGSNPPASSVLHEHITSAVVTYIPIPDALNGTNPQFTAYNRCLATYSTLHKFIGFIDVDEFVIVGLRRVNIGKLLDHYRDFGGLSLNWKIFGSSGHDNRPIGGVLQNYCTCQPGFDMHTKVFVNTAKVNSLEAEDPLCSYGDEQGKVLFTTNPHNVCFARKDLFSVSITFKEVRGPFQDLRVTAPLMFINHYMTKSRSDYQRKIERGRADLPVRRGDPTHDRSWELFESVQSACTSRQCGCSDSTRDASID